MCYVILIWSEVLPMYPETWRQDNSNDSKLCAQHRSANHADSRFKVHCSVRTRYCTISILSIWYHCICRFNMYSRSSWQSMLNDRSLRHCLGKVIRRSLSPREVTVKDNCVTNKDEAPAVWPIDPASLLDGQKLCVCSGDKCNDNPGGGAALVVTLPLVIAAALSGILNSLSNSFA